MSETLTKQKITELLHAKFGCSKIECERLVDVFFSVIIETLAKGEMVKISGFGNFCILDKNARPGRNPRTGEEVTVSKRRVVTFRPGNKFKSMLEGYDGEVEA